MSRPATVPLGRRERRARAREQSQSSRRSIASRPAAPMWQSPMVLASLAALALGLAVILVAWHPWTESSSRQLIDGPTAYPSELTAGAVLGSPSAKVVIQLYADFQCPACKQFVTAELPRLVADYVVPGTVRIEARDIDVLGNGTADESLNLAIGAACAAEQDRYWPFHDLVFWNQGRENRGDHDAAFIAAVAGRAGVDRGAWEACIGRSDVRQSILDQTRSARSAGFRYTPTLVVNGHTLVGLPAYPDLTALIDQLAGS